VSDVLLAAIVNNAFWLIVFIVAVALFHQQIGALIDSVGSFSFAGGGFEFKGDKRATLVSYTVLGNILIEMLSEKRFSKRLTDLISTASGRRLQGFIRQYARDVRTDDWNVTFLKNVGIIIRRKLSSEAALEVFRLLNDRKPHDREILYELGVTLVKTGDQKHAEEAEQIYSTLLGSYARPKHYYMHGLANAALSKFDDALRDLEKAIDMKYYQENPTMLDTDQHPHLRRLEAERSDEFKKLRNRMQPAKVPAETGKQPA
jgi:hypothetical protein